MAEKARVKIRVATGADASNILGLLKQMPATSDIRYPPLNDADTLMWITTVMREGVVFVADYSGRIVGSIGIWPQRFPWNLQHWRGTAAWWFVSPSFRKGGASVALANASKTWAKDRDLKLALGTMMGRNPLILDRMVRMLGFKYAGGSFVSDHFVPEE